MPTTDSPARAMMTVRPANTTAEPAVPTARPAASSASPPVRKLVPVAGDDEQRIVDRHGQAEHQRQRRRGRRQVDEAARGGDSADADPDTEDRRQQGQAGGEQRAERDNEYDRGDADADDLGAALLGLCLDRVTPHLHLQPGIARGLDGCGQGVARLLRQARRLELRTRPVRTRSCRRGTRRRSRTGRRR